MHKAAWLKKSLVVFTCALTGCAALSTTKSAYDYDLDAGSKAQDADGALTITELQQHGLLFTFANKGSKSQKIVWDECALVDADGKSHRIIHGETKFTDADKSQPSTLVPATASISDSLSYADGNAFTAAGWMPAEIIPCSNVGAMCSRDQYLGKALSFILTTEMDGKKREYTAKMKLKRSAN